MNIMGHQGGVRHSIKSIGKRTLSSLRIFLGLVWIAGCTTQIHSLPQTQRATSAQTPLSGIFLVSSITPPSPSQTLNPIFKGRSTVPALTVSFYSDFLCLGSQLASASEAQFEIAGVVVSLQANALTPVYGRAYAIDGSPATPCTLVSNYTSDTASPIVTLSAPVNGSFLNVASANPTVFTGACSEEGLPVFVTGSVTGTGTCSAGHFTFALDLTSARNGTLSFSASQTDAAGNFGVSSAVNLTKDTVLPTVVISSPSSISYINSSTVAAVTFSGNCSENGRSVVLSGALSTSVTCTSGAWSTVLDLSTAPEGALTIYADHSDAAGNASAQASRTLIKDTAQPSVVITAPGAATYISSAAAVAFTLSGTCSEDGRSVLISGSAIATAICSSGIWNTTLDLSPVPDGTLVLNANQTDAAGNAATQSSRSYSKVSNPGGVDTIAIAAGASYTTTATVTLAITSTNYRSQMYLTNTAGCVSGGVWESYGTSKSGWILSQTNAPAAVYVKFRDAAGNVSACISDTIIHDNIIPTVAITNPAAGTFINSANVGAFSVSGTCSENGRNVVISGSLSSVVTCASNAWTTNLDFSAVADGGVSISASILDAAGNVSILSSRNFTKASDPGGADTISIANGAAYTNSSIVTLALSSSNYQSEMYITNTAGCSLNGVWETYAASKAGWVLGQTNGTATVYIKYKDIAGNVSACINDTIVHDDIIPTVAITSPASGSYVNSLNATNFTVSGTCSENGRNVAITGAVSNFITCSSGTWSTSLDLSGAADGALTLNADLADAAGNSAAQSSRIFTKVSDPGGADSISIASGASYTNANPVALTLASANHQSQMYVTNTAECTAGGVWESYATSKTGWTLSQTNATATVYVKFEDAAGNISACISDTVIHDNILPTLAITSPAAGSFMNASGVNTFTVSGTCSEIGRTITIGGATAFTTACTGSNTWTVGLDLHLVSDGSVTITADLGDIAGNNAVQATRAFIKDASLPTVAITSPASGAFVTPGNMAAFTVSGSCSENSASVMLSGAASATVACSGGTWTNTFDLSGLAQGMFTIYADHADAAGNSAVQASRSFVKDTVLPTLSISAPTPGSFVNAGNVASLIVTGTCSENGRNITFSNAASGIATCSAGTFSTTLDFSAAAQGALSLKADLSDAASNAATQASVSVTKDTVPPTLTISAPLATTVANKSGSVSYTITVSGSASVNITPADITLGTTAGATCTKSITGGTTTSVTVTLTNCVGVTGTVNVTVGAGISTDTAGNSSNLTGPSAAFTIVSSPFTQTWAFDALDSASYSFDSSRIDLTSGVVRLSGNDQKDDANDTAGFGSATLDGVSWDAGNNVIRLNSNSYSELSSTWTPQYSAIKSYLKLNGGVGSAIADGTPIAAAIGASGTASNANGTGMSFLSAIENQGISFDGTDDRIDVPQGATIANSFSVAGWFKAGAADGADHYVFNAAGGTNFIALNTTGGTGTVVFGSNDSHNIYKACFYAVGVTGSWHHFVGIRDGGLQTQTLYIDGIPVVSVADTRTGNFDLNSITLSPTPNRYFGALDDFALWNTALTANEVQTIYAHQRSRYSGGLTSRVMDAYTVAQAWTTLSWMPTLPFSKELPDFTGGSIQNESSAQYTSLVGSTGATGDDNLMAGIAGLWHLNEASGTSGTSSVKDSSGNGKDGSPTAVTFGSKGNFKTAAAFDGSTSIVDTGAWNLSTSNFTVSAWVYPTSVNSGADHPVIAKYDSVSGNYRSFYLGLNYVSSGDVTFGTSDAGSNNIHKSTLAGAVTLNTWSHILVTYTAGAIAIYVNGVNKSLTTSTSSGAAPTGAPFSSTIPVRIGSATGHGGAAKYFKGSIDEVAIWTRVLHPKEILQMYRRGGNRARYQVRVCAAADCSDDVTGAKWKGADGTNQTYFSELNNNSLPNAVGGLVKKTLPAISFSDFTSPVGTSRYFQYRLMLESDDPGTGCDYGGGPTWCGPEIKSVTVDPVHFDAGAPTVTGRTGVDTYSLATFTQTLGASCASGIGYNLGVGASYASATWYWWDATANAGSGGWVLADATVLKSNDASTITSHAASYGSTVGTNTVYFKAFLKSSGTSACELDNLSLSGQQ